MLVQSQIEINGSRDKIWQALSDIENSAKVFKDIKRIEVLDRPSHGLRGLKWKEVREFMGKEAEETLWVTEESAATSYTTEAYNSGCLYRSSVQLEGHDNSVIVTRTFEATPKSWIAKLMSPMMYFVKGTLKKCLVKDLEDLKDYAEQNQK